MTSLPTGPTRWVPETEDDIESAIDEGWMEESHYLEIKREVTASKSGRKEHARDLAGFALDGGHLLIGVEEDKANKTWRREPQELAGLAERVEQIARQTVDPPLYVRAHEIPGGDDPQRGYILVEVPPSAEAPHMVDGTYFGRGEKTRTRLSDSEVLRLHRARDDRADLIERLLDFEIGQDPVPANQRDHGHLFLVAEPLVGRRGMARQFLQEPAAKVREFIEAGEANVPRHVRESSPSLVEASAYVRRARGLAYCSHDLRAGRKLGPDFREKRLVDVEIHEDGGLRVFVGRMTDNWTVNEASSTWIMEAVAVAYAYRIVIWARTMADAVGYTGTWGLGLAATRLRTHQGFWTRDRIDSDYAPHYDQDAYREVTFASLAELHESPHEIVDRLVGSLLRSLGTYMRLLA